MADRKGWMGVALCLASASALAGVQMQAGQVVAGGHAMVAGAEGRVVFDGSSAAGAQALRIEDAKGALVRQVDLAAFLPASYVHALPRDGEGLRWWRDATLDEAQHQVLFRVPVPGSASGATGPALQFSIDLRDGSVRTAQIREYLAAVDESRKLGAPSVAAR